MSGPRIKYAPGGGYPIFVDFDRAPNQISLETLGNREVLQANSGVEETLFYFDQQFPTFSKRLLTAQEQVEVDEFYEFAKDGSVFLFEYDRDLGTYIDFEGRSLKTNDETSATFTRSGAVFYLDHHSGLIEQASPNAAKFVSGKYGGGVRVDGAYTNLITHPSTLDDASWTAVGITVSANTTETKDPAGDNTADKLTATTTGGLISAAGTASPSGDMTYAVWLKCPTGTVSVKLFIDGATSGSTSATVTVTPEWQQFSVTADTSGYTGAVGTILQIVTNGDVVYAYDAAFYDGLAFAPTVSPDPAATTSATANAETLTYSTDNIFNPLKGTIGFWFKPLWLGSTSAGVSETSGAYFFSVTDGSNRCIELSYGSNASTGFYQLGIRDSTNTLHLDTTPPVGVTVDWHHAVVTWDSTTGAYAIYIDGSSIISTSTTAWTPNEAYSTLYLGSLNGTTQRAYCAFDDFFIRKDVLNATEISQIYNAGRGLGTRRNRWSGMRLADPNLNPVYRGGVNRFDLELRMKEQL